MLDPIQYEFRILFITLADMEPELLYSGSGSSQRFRLHITDYFADPDPGKNHNADPDPDTDPRTYVNYSNQNTSKSDLSDIYS
jgi:hypothetical protein